MIGLAQNTPERSSPEYSNVHERVTELLKLVGIALELPVDRSDFCLYSGSAHYDAPEGLLRLGGQQVGIIFQEAILTAGEATALAADGFPVVLLGSGRLVLLHQTSTHGLELIEVGDDVQARTLSVSELNGILKKHPITFVAKRALECTNMSSVKSKSGKGVARLKPWRRFVALLRLDQRDILTVVLFAFVAGVLTLATPLAIESLVNVVSWGTYLQPLIVLACMLLACLGIAGILRVLQAVVVEIIQRRQFVRIVGDLAHRFPRASREALDGVYPRELANRVFDVMTIQKATATLLIDGLSIVLTTTLGLLLLAFYHPFLLGFDVVLVICMLSITWLLGRGGVRTAVAESSAKYRVAHWLQDVLSTPTAFKAHDGEILAAERTNRLTSEYLLARQEHFRVVFRQIAFAISLQVVASTVLLGLGGWLVIRQQLTLGQLVASELVVTVVLSAFSKAGKSLEKYYDLMAGIDKVGYLIDLPVESPRLTSPGAVDGPELTNNELAWRNLSIPETNSVPSDHTIPSGGKSLLVATNPEHSSRLLQAIAGLRPLPSGSFQVGGLDVQTLQSIGKGHAVAYAGRPEVFHGSIQDNVTLARPTVSRRRMQTALSQVGLWEDVLRLPAGIETALQSDGQPLSHTQQAQLMLARALAASPSVLLIDQLLDQLPANVLEYFVEQISNHDDELTVVVATTRPERFRGWNEVSLDGDEIQV